MSLYLGEFWPDLCVGYIVFTVLHSVFMSDTDY